MKEYNYASDIENLSESEARELCYRSVDIKGHQVYLIKFEGRMGQSAIVYLNGVRITGIHEPNMRGKHIDDKYVEYTYEEREKIFLHILSNRLFTEKELCGRLKSYRQFCRKDDYIRNYYSCQKKRISIFDAGFFSKGDKRAETAQAEFERKTKDMFFSPVTFSYYEDKAFVEKLNELSDALHRQLVNRKNSFKFWVEAFKYEMYNHEFTYCEDDYTVLSAFGVVDYGRTLDGQFSQLGFSPVQRKAYRFARQEVLKIA